MINREIKSNNAVAVLNMPETSSYLSAYKTSGFTEDLIVYSQQANYDIKKLINKELKDNGYNSECYGSYSNLFFLSLRDNLFKG